MWKSSLFSLKVFINTSFRDKDFASVWETLLIKTAYKDDFENVLHHVEILLVQPISAAQCERAILAQNRIKSSIRVNLAVSMLEDLIRISAEGRPAAEFDPTPSVNKWLAWNRDAGERLRRPHFQRSSLKWSRSVELCIPTGIPIDRNMSLLH